MSRENRKMPSFKQELMSIYDASSAIHPIPEYKTSKHGIMYTNIICKDKKERDDQLMVRSCGADASVVAF